MAESNNVQAEQNFTDEKVVEVELALKIARRAVERVNVPDISTYEPPPTNSRWRLFAEHSERNLNLIYEGSGATSFAVIKTSLSITSHFLVTDIKALLSNSEACKLLDVSDSEVEAEIYDQAVSILTTYVGHLPMIIHHSLHQAIKESIINQIKKFIEPNLREHWQNLGLPKNFELIANDNLDDLIKLFPLVNLELIQSVQDVDKKFSEYRKKAFSDKKVWLTNEVLLTLPREYERLKKEYKKAKKYHDSTHKIFRENNPRANSDSWGKYWEDQMEQLFPELYCLDQLQNYDVFELAKLHLAKLYDYSLDTMDKKLNEAKKLLAEKSPSQD